MQIPVLVEPVANNGFRARSGEPLPLCADGATAEEAVRNLRAAMDRHVAGKQLTSVELPPDNPWVAMAGMFDPNDPLIQEWKEEMAKYRQEVESDPNRP
jgi:predicted RNase H-like HicB family nuclease